MVLFLIFSFLFNLVFIFLLQKRNFSLPKIKRNKKIKLIHATADFIDYILLNLEAGQNIYASFAHASHSVSDPDLRDYCKKVLVAYYFGESLTQAFVKAAKTQEEFSVCQELSESIALSLQLGTPLAQSLSHLGLSLRVRANTELEELAAKAPIKMIFPLVFFIFPVIFILLGSGAIENFLRSFSG